VKATARFFIGLTLTVCGLLSACQRPAVTEAPKFTGRLLVLAGDTAGGADLVEVTPPSSGPAFNYATVTTGVREAVPSPDRTRLLYTTKDEIVVRDLRSGSIKSLVKGECSCLAWAPDGNRFSYKQKSGAQTKLYSSDLDGKTKLISTDPSSESDCAHWIAPDRLIFERFVGVPSAKGGVKPNTTTLAIVNEAVKLIDSERKWSVEAVCPSGGGAFLRPHDQAQPILVAKNLDNLKTLDPKPIDCSGCRFAGFAAQSCVPFFIQDATSTTTDLVSLNPINWQRQKPATISLTFSLNARMVIKSSAKLMVVGDALGKLFLVDTESGEFVSFFPKSSEPAIFQGKLLTPVIWIEN